MRSDLKINTNTINKMIQFGTVKYGIVKQLKDRSRSERDVSSDQDENGTSMPNSPVVECSKSATNSPTSQQATTLISNFNSNSNHHHHHHQQHHHQQNNHSSSDEDHNHNNNLATTLDVHLINHNKNSNNNSNSSQDVLYQQAPLQSQESNSPIKSTDLLADTNHIVTESTATTMILPSSIGYSELEKINNNNNNNHKTPSPALADQNCIADQPQSPLVERLTGGLAASISTTVQASSKDINKTDSNNDECNDDDDDDDLARTNDNSMDKTEAEKINDTDKSDQSQRIKKDMLDTGDNDDDKLSEKNLPSTAVEATNVEVAANTNATSENQMEKNNNNCDSPTITTTTTTAAAAAGAITTQMPQFPAGPVTLEAIQNMQMAIAQFAAKTFANGGGNGEANEAAMKQLAFLQQTLFNLQQQQLFQIQLIQQLQSQLALNQMKTTTSNADDNSDDEIDGDRVNNNINDNNSSVNDNQNLVNTKKRRKSDEKSDVRRDDNEDMNIDDDDDDDADHFDDDMDDDEKDCMIEFKKFRPEEPLEYGEIRPPYDHRPLLSYPKQDENMPLPYGSDLASSIITNHDDAPSSNCLEMLQKSTQEVLDSASQGILSGNLADDFAFGKDRNGSKNGNEPFFKHRCRYCGKVFGSDSALQIHIRSHTGERPFKCNVCGSRFTTKGNLKVHFQRHAQKFPHVPMNSTPIPEHLDKFHPPLLDQMSPDSTPPHQPQIPNVPVSLPLAFPTGANFPLYRPPLDLLKSLGPYANPFFDVLPPIMPTQQQQQQQQQKEQKLQKESCKNDDEEDEEENPASKSSKEDQEMPTDLRKPSAPSSPVKSKDDEKVNDDEILPAVKIKTEKCDDEESEEIPQKNEKRPITPASPSLPPPSQVPTSQPSVPMHLPPHHPHQQQSPLQPLMVLPHHHADLPISSAHLYPHFRDEIAEHHHRMAMNFRISPERRSPNRSPASIASSMPRSPFINSMKHEMALLPRPHSNDNSWENFIEVSNTSETLKLKELMKNKKITDPNQCVVCDRVLSCKSALQMHYRTHTGERPFKCRICGRAFTTKGNLKTHMAVHKIRPPMRNFHQCPVCHKKYSNALVLQQHIRLHTGEPTDLTPEQISAAEIRDFPPSMVPGSFLNPFAFNFGMAGGVGHHNGHLDSESSLGELDDNMDCSDDFDDDISEHGMSNGGENTSTANDYLSDRPKSRDDVKEVLFEQKLKLEASHPVNSSPSHTRENQTKSESSINSPPASPASAIIHSKPSPSLSDTSQGALDLTPRAPPQQSIQQQQQQLPKPSQAEQQLSNQSIHPSQHHHHHHQRESLHHQQLPSPQSHPISHMMAQRPPFGMFPNLPLFPPQVSSSTHNMCTAMNTIAQSVMPSAPFNPLALSGVRGSTTCGICFKTFPCHSALEIHYRSHTKERPFKCSICDRGFTTKGNLKQHMLTHKIRDMEQDAFRNRAIKFEYMRNVKDDYE